MHMFKGEGQQWMSFMASRMVRPAWQVRAGAPPVALNPAAAALGAATVIPVARALFEGQAGVDSWPGYEVLPLPEVDGGSFFIVGPQTLCSRDRALLEAEGLWMLSSRQVEVLREICDGCPPKEIAEHLSISAYTARDHIKALLDKSGCVTRVEMVGKLLRMG